LLIAMATVTNAVWRVN